MPETLPDPERQPVYQLRRMDTGVLLGTFINGEQAVQYLRDHYPDPPPYSIVPVTPWDAKDA